MSDSKSVDDISKSPSSEEGTGGKKQVADFWLAVFESQSVENIKVDFNKLAQKCGYMNANSARAQYFKRRNALLENSTAKGTGSSAPAVTEAKVRKPKVTKAVGTGGAKRGRKPKASQSVAPPPEEEKKAGLMEEAEDFLRMLERD